MPDKLSFLSGRIFNEKLRSPYGGRGDHLEFTVRPPKNGTAKTSQRSRAQIHSLEISSCSCVRIWILLKTLIIINIYLLYYFHIIFLNFLHIFNIQFSFVLWYPCTSCMYKIDADEWLRFQNAFLTLASETKRVLFQQYVSLPHPWSQGMPALIVISLVSDLVQALIGVL